jgi:hypothetical protein
LTPVLLLLAAIAWRWRDRRWVSGSALAAALSLKLFLWPLLVWFLATRRFGAAGIAAGLALVATLGAWAVIGFEGMTSYPELLRLLTDIVETVGLSLVALGDQAGLPSGLARTLPLLVGIPLLAAVFVVARREDGDRRAFSLAVIAAIAITPIVWLHYFTLLVLPLALARPRLAWPWALMWAFWLVPAQGNEGHIWRILLAVAFTAVAACGSQAGDGGSRATVSAEAQVETPVDSAADVRRGLACRPSCRTGSGIRAACSLRVCRRSRHPRGFAARSDLTSAARCGTRRSRSGTDDRLTAARRV